MLKKLMALSVMALLAASLGCQTTGNPREGGLFGWSSDKAQQRLDQRQQNLSQLKSRQQQQEAETLRLEQERRAKTAEQAKIKKDIKRLDADIVRIKREIASYRAQTTAKQEEKVELQKRLNATKAEVNRVRADALMSEDEKRAEIARLRKEIKTLMEMASLLTTQ
jgi:chromosome segregation ATPase